jgi:hypothetical protein
VPPGRPPHSERVIMHPPPRVQACVWRWAQRCAQRGAACSAASGGGGGGSGRRGSGSGTAGGGRGGRYAVGDGAFCAAEG